MGEPGVIILPISASGQHGGSSSDLQSLDPETRELVANTVQNMLKGNAASSQHQTQQGPNGTYEGSDKNIGSSGRGPSYERGGSHKQAQYGSEAETVKGLISNPSGLYHIINWDDPNLTLASLVTAMTFIFAAGYLHVSQWILKALCVALGLLTVVKGVGQAASLKKQTPKTSSTNYYKIPDQTLDRAFSEIREALQFAVVQSQKIMLGEDVSKTGIAFAVTFVSYWLIKLVPLWWLALLITPIIYLIPLVFKNVSKDDLRNLRDQAGAKSGNALNAAGSKASDLQKQAQAKSADAFNTSRDKVSDLTGQAQQKSTNALNNAGNKASDLQDHVYDTSRNTANFAQDKASNLTSQVQDTSSNIVNNARNYGSDLQDGVAQRKPYESHQNEPYQSHQNGQGQSHQNAQHQFNQDGPGQSLPNEQFQLHQNGLGQSAQSQSYQHVPSYLSKSRPSEQYQ